MITSYVDEESGELPATVRKSGRHIPISMSDQLPELAGRVSTRSDVPDAIRRTPFYAHHIRDDGHTFVGAPAQLRSEAQAQAALDTLPRLEAAARAFLGDRWSCVTAPDAGHCGSGASLRPVSRESARREAGEGARARPAVHGGAAGSDRRVHRKHGDRSGRGQWAQGRRHSSTGQMRASRNADIVRLCRRAGAPRHCPTGRCTRRIGPATFDHDRVHSLLCALHVWIGRVAGTIGPALRCHGRSRECSAVHAPDWAGSGR